MNISLDIVYQYIIQKLLINEMIIVQSVEVYA